MEWIDRNLLLQKALASTHLDNEGPLITKLQSLATNCNWCEAELVGLFEALHARFESSPTNDRPGLPSWMIKVLHSIEIHYISPSLKLKDGQTVRQLVRDLTLPDETLLDILSSDKDKELTDILEEIRQQRLKHVDEALLTKVEDTVSTVCRSLKSPDGESDLQGLERILFLLCLAVKKAKGYKPRLTQMVSWLLMVLSETGWLIQVGTGEGKSCIIAMFAAFRAKRDGTVDIMSSSRVLAERDYLDWKTFYENMGISVNCNTGTSRDDAALKKCYQCQVVYGTPADFAGDWLKHHFLRLYVRGERQFQCAIVDEADSLMLDRAQQMVYLSSNMPAMQHLNPLLALIWHTVHQFNNSQTTACRYMYSNRESLISAAEEIVKGFVQFTQCGVIDDAALCHVPGFLAKLVNSKLKLWISNAFRAQTLTMDDEYIVEQGGVVPVDYRYTGVVQNRMKWSDGLQQFLEIKHWTKMSNMTVVTNFMSNICLFQKYSTQIYGITGTLGNQSEREVFQKLYNGVKTCDIPSFKRRKLFEVKGLVVEDDDKWIREICKVVKVQISPTPFRAERAVLVICETINKAKAVYNALGIEIRQKTLYINNNHDNSAIFQKKLEAGDVIIATNLAGRGTDLAVSDQVNNAGGLFVVQTFLPPNVRVEQQAFGRTARQGSPGCAQLVVCLHHLPTSVKGKASGLATAKTERDESVANRLSSYVDNDIEAIKKKENLFSQYLVILDEFYKSYSNKPPQSDVDCLNETWGVWLLMRFDEDDAFQDLTSRLDADMKAARAKVASRNSPSSNLHHYTGFGNDLREAGKPEESIAMYTRAIKEDGVWAAVALYNRALVVLSQKNRAQDGSCINRALADLVNADESIKLYQRQIKATLDLSNLATRNPNHSATRFYKHIMEKLKLLELFEANVDQAIVALWEARKDYKVVEVTTEPVWFLLIEALLPSILAQKGQWLKSTPCEDSLMELNSLKSMGLTHIFTVVPQFSVIHYFKRFLV